MYWYQVSSHFTSLQTAPQKRRVSIIVKKSKEIKSVELIYTQKDGNAIGVKISYDYGPLVIYSVYGPNSQDVAFLRELGREIARARSDGAA